jgi:hypothetical protein
MELSRDRRRGPRGGRCDQPAAIEPRSVTAIRILAGQAVFAAFVAVCVLVASPPVGIALGAALWQLGTAVAIRRWERRNAMRLLVHRDRFASLDAARVYAVDLQGV